MQYVLFSFFSFLDTPYLIRPKYQPSFVISSMMMSQHVNAVLQEWNPLANGVPFTKDH